MANQINTVKVDKQITLYQRSDHKEKFWQCRLRIKDEGGKKRYLIRSTNELDLEEAKKAAYKLLIESEGLLKAGVSVFGVKFDRVWREYFEDQKYQVSVDAITQSRVTSKRNMTNRWIRSRFASKAINSITDNDMREYWQWRINFADSDEAKDALKETGGKYFAKKPKPVTLHEESMVISQIFRFAVSKQYIKSERIPNLSPPVKWSTNRRYPFDRKEIKKILVDMARRASEATPVRADAWLRLNAKVHLMVDTGMRPTEANNLKWGDYQLWYKHEDETTYTNIFVHGKGKQRTLLTDEHVGKALDRYKKSRRPNAKDDEYVFTTTREGKQATRDNEMFGQVLEHLSLLKDKKGNNRTLYSLRHSYATHRLLDGNVDWNLLSMNMGTSVKMIKDHYGHVIPQQKAAEITFSSQRELAKKQREENRRKQALEDAANVVVLDQKKV